MPEVASSGVAPKGETGLLRTPPYYKVRADLFPYRPHDGPDDISIMTKGVRKRPKRVTNSLKIGEMSEFVSYAHVAYQQGTPLNVLITARLSTILRNPDHRLFSSNGYDLMKIYNDGWRRWCWRPKRRFKAKSIIVREMSPKEGEHIHHLTHVPADHIPAAIDYIERFTGERRLSRKRTPDVRTRGEVACGEKNSWHFATEFPDGKPEFQGYWAAAYIGKAEASERLFRGRLVPNSSKLERGIEFGGRIKNSRYDQTQGYIIGSAARRGRYLISRALIASRNDAQTGLR
ncbi:hypothetical protein CLV78_105226 [Aliiruegeria haliotis]|uniref:Uncharacterized protein n=1 Tax=Aliiruegeria haliotis TaxID=1280846 RepID=A0A2T0RPV6_9RHOB|nr:hypothetical protein [Aliiruegeria haliotis]PRY23172.1 hypothetical protein CLV78_105226 [Aliiruegeria haliotis]